MSKETRTTTPPKQTTTPSHVWQAEIVVVGAGPGGSAAAWALARLGHDVLLVDRASFPRDKTCGDGLTPSAVRTLREMGVLTQVEAVGAQRIDSVSITGPAGMRTSLALDEHLPPGASYALVLPRLQLDDILLQHAVTAGGRFRSQVDMSGIRRDGHRITSVLANTPDGAVEVRAEHVVLAVGASMGVLRREGLLGHDPQMIRAARMYCQVRGIARNAFSFYYDRDLLPGYGWIFPAGKGMANVGVGILPRPGTSPPSTATLLERFIARRVAQGDIQAAEPVAPSKGYPLRLDFLSQAAAGTNWVLVGEAAGLVNPLTGEGIDLALESGLLAGRTLHADITEGRVHHLGYQRALSQRYAPMFRGLPVLRDLIARPVLADYVTWLTRQHHFLATTMLRVALGIKPPAAVVHPLFLLQVFLPLSPRFVAQHLLRQANARQG